MTRAVTTVACVLLPLLACDSPAAPKNDSLALRLGEAREGDVTGADSVTYRLHASAGDVFALYLEARDSAVIATIRNPSGEYVVQISHAGARRSGDPARWVRFSASVEGDYTIRVIAADPSRIGGRFELTVEAVENAPETAALLIHLDDTISTEALDRPGDVDEFEFDGVAGQDVHLFLQSLAPGTSELIAELLRPRSSDPFAEVPLQDAPAVGADEDFESGTSGSVRLPATGRFRLRIANVGIGWSRRNRESYRFQVYAIDRAPESVPALLSPGDTVSEAVDHVGDVDEYTFSATAGSVFNAFLETGGVAPHEASVTVVGTDGYGPALASGAAPIGQPLLDNPTGTFVMPASGRLTIRVSDKQSGGGIFRGPYRLFVYPIDPDPEDESAELVPGPATVSGAIDQYGDVDEYSFTVTSPTTLMALRSDPSGSVASRLRLLVLGGGIVATDNQRNFLLDPGSYRLRIAPRAPGTRDSFRGPYQFVLAPVDTQPEHTTATLAVDDTVRLETSAWPWDIDRFRIAATSADTVVVELWRPDDPAWTQRLFVENGDADAMVFQLLQPRAGTVTASQRIDLVADRTVTISVEGLDTTWHPGAVGSYRLVARRVSAAPEHHAVAIAIGDTVREPLDYYGDVDDYILRGTPGQEINVSGGWPISEAPPVFVITLLDASSGATLASLTSFDFRYSQTTQIPAGGEVRVRVCVGVDCVYQACPGGYCQYGPPPLPDYWLVVNAIDRAPETVSASIAIGDTVSGEALENSGDIDEFYFDGVAGERISAQLQWLSGVSPGSLTVGVRLQIVQVATGGEIGQLDADYQSERLEDIALSPIVLPRTGRYMIRVQSHSDPAYGFRNYGPYRFRMVAVP